MQTNTIKFALPKGRMAKGVTQLLADAGIRVRETARGYRPEVNLPNYDVKILKPRAIIEMLHEGARDLGFAGADWVEEHCLTGELVELLDTKLDPVRLVAAAPTDLLVEGKLPTDLGRPLIIASEYTELTHRWIKSNALNAKLLRSYGATEVLPPEDADCIIDNTATGATLQANSLKIIDDVMHSSTRLYANPAALEDPTKKAAIEDFVTLVTSVLQARTRVMLEVNVTSAALDAVIELLPAMRKPTIATIHGSNDFAVKAAIPRANLPTLIPRIKAAGGTDLVITNPEQIVP
ncbi:MAG: ATP phosphoribosyltransferase [Planctomycetota bacterium]